MTDTDGLYTGNPHTDPSARLIPVISKVTDRHLSCAGNAVSDVGTGGMRTKIQTAGDLSALNVSTVIANGQAEHPLSRLFTGNVPHTYALSAKERITARNTLYRAQQTVFRQKGMIK